MASDTGRTGTWNPHVPTGVTSTGGSVPQMKQYAPEFRNASAQDITGETRQHGLGKGNPDYGVNAHKKRGTTGASHAISVKMPAQAVQSQGTQASGKLLQPTHSRSNAWK